MLTGERHIDLVVGSGDPNQKALDALYGMNFGDGARFTLKGNNARIISNQSSPDCFTYCVSNIATKSTMRQFRGTDTCVEISDMYPFLIALTEIVKTVCPVQFSGFHQVSYANRDQKWNDEYEDIPPALIKEVRFAPQSEWRAVWNPLTNRKIEPIITLHKEITSLVRVSEL